MASLVSVVSMLFCLSRLISSPYPFPFCLPLLFLLNISPFLGNTAWPLQSRTGVPTPISLRPATICLTGGNLRAPIPHPGSSPVLDIYKDSTLMRLVCPFTESIWKPYKTGTLFLPFCTRYTWITQCWVRWRFKEHKISKSRIPDLNQNLSESTVCNFLLSLRSIWMCLTDLMRDSFTKMYLGLEWQGNHQTSLVSIISLLLHVPTKYQL